MVRMRWPRVVAVLVLGGAVPACGRRVPVEELPTPPEIMAVVGERLGRTLSPPELARAAARDHRLLRLLRPQERDALGRNLIRFRVDRPAFIEVAAPADSAPFWLDEQGFVSTHHTLVGTDGLFVIYHKCVASGWVGLGVDALVAPRRPPYAVFVLPRDPGPAPTITGLTPATARPVRAEDGVSPFVDAHKPFPQLHPHLRGATLVQTSFAGRGATALALGGADGGPSAAVK